MPFPSRSLRTLLTAILVVPPVAGVAVAQPSLFGSLDDPSEAHRLARWDRTREVRLLGGLSLIGAQWRTAMAGRFHVEAAHGSALVEGALRAGIYGSYDPDHDETYDLARSLRYVRLDPLGRRFAYVRVGPVRRGRLGMGHLVSFFDGEAAWDDRRVGLELRLGSENLALYALAQDLRLGNVVGGRATWRPLGAARSGTLRSVEIGGSWVADRATRHLDGVDPVVAWEADIRVEAARSGAFALFPFVSYARFTSYGEGLLFGADLESDNFIDLARLHARLAVHYGSDRFVPGYFGAFYPVSNLRDGIVEENPIDFQSRAGVSLPDIRKATSVLAEGRIHIFERFEFWFAFRRHYGPQSLSTMHVRMFLRARRFRFELAHDRGGLKGLFSTAGALGSEATLTFRTDYRLVSSVWIHAEARYTYERLPAGDPPGGPRYLPQRRFEPYLGVRVPL
jgi:hypothetical protein